MNMIDMNVLRDLTNAFGPSGFEEDVVRAVMQRAESLFLCWMPIQMSADLWYRGSWKMVC